LEIEAEADAKAVHVGAAIEAAGGRRRKTDRGSAYDTPGMRRVVGSIPTGMWNRSRRDRLQS
jgi:hypothetical protein